MSRQRTYNNLPGSVRGTTLQNDKRRIALPMNSPSKEKKFGQWEAYEDEDDSSRLPPPGGASPPMRGTHKSVKYHQVPQQRVNSERPPSMGRPPQQSSPSTLWVGEGTHHNTTSASAAPSYNQNHRGGEASPLPPPASLSDLNDQNAYRSQGIGGGVKQQPLQPVHVPPTPAFTPHVEEPALSPSIQHHQVVSIVEGKGTGSYIDVISKVHLEKPSLLRLKLKGDISRLPMRAVKETLFQVTGVPSERQVLEKDGFYISDALTASDISLVSGSVLVLSLAGPSQIIESMGSRAGDRVFYYNPPQPVRQQMSPDR